MATTSFFFSPQYKIFSASQLWFLFRVSGAMHLCPSYVVHCFYSHYRFDLDLHFPIVNAYIFAYILLSIVVALCSEHERE